MQHMCRSDLVARMIPAPILTASTGSPDRAVLSSAGKANRIGGVISQHTNMSHCRYSLSDVTPHALRRIVTRDAVIGCHERLNKCEGGVPQPDGASTVDHLGSCN